MLLFIFPNLLFAFVPSLLLGGGSLDPFAFGPGPFLPPLLLALSLLPLSETESSWINLHVIFGSFEFASGSKTSHSWVVVPLAKSPCACGTERITAPLSTSYTIWCSRLPWALRKSVIIPLYHFPSSSHNTETRCEINARPFGGLSLLELLLLLLSLLWPILALYLSLFWQLLFV